MEEACPFQVCNHSLNTIDYLNFDCALTCNKSVCVGEETCPIVKK